MKTFPMFLQMAGRRVVIMGGGEQAAQKARLILKTEATVEIWSATFDAELSDLAASGRVTLHDGPITPHSFSDTALAFIATGCPGADMALHVLAKEGGAIVNVVDQPQLCDAITPSIVDRDPVVVAIGTEGTAPVLARQIKTKVEEMLEPRLGDFAAFTESALLRKGQDEESSLAEVPRTPTAVSDLLAAYHQGESREFAIDPTQGSVLEALAQQPTLWERFQQGGYVGYVVVVLGGIGLLVALAQYIYLLTVSARVRRQRQNLDQPSKDNPLGRVLERFKEMDKHQTPEALEARLDEAVLAELPKIERGQPIVKLLAAIAPLLGLLGTVTGMIVTFQAITVFGTGDPQLMAGGISQALVTTVLGLVTAVPLLFAQTALSSRSRFITQVIEGEASATLADHLEAQFTLSGQTVN